MSRAVLLAALMVLSYALVAVNLRAIAQARYAWAVVTDLGIAALGFTLIRMVGEAKSTSELAGYTLGAGCGSVIGIWLTKRAWRER